MLSAIILVCCIGAMGQFFVAYCRALLAGCDAHVLSERARQIAGIHGEALDPGEFHRLLGIARMTGMPASDTVQIRAVKSYYRVLCLVEGLLPSRFPRALQWIHRELSRCAYFAAVVLDRRLGTTD